MVSLVGEAVWVEAAVERRMWDLALVCFVFAFLAGLNYHRWGKR